MLKILETQNLVRVIAFDFSKAFDTVKHASVLESFDKLELPDDVVIFFQNRTHQTKYQNETSNVATINASVIQGSALGPVALTAIASTLKPASDKNYIFKYADDTYLIIPEDQFNTTEAEIKNIESWAENNNLRLNKEKSKEIIFSRPRNCHELPEKMDNIPRVQEINVLGISLDTKLRIRNHVRQTISKCSSQFYTRKILRSQENIQNMFSSLVIDR